MQNNKTTTGLNNQLKPSEVYEYIRDKEDFNVSEEAFTSNLRFEGNEISSSEKNNESYDGFNVVDENQSLVPKPLKIPYFLKQDKVIITTPAHDSGNDNIATEAQKIDAVLEKVKDKLVNSGKILVPICQENKILGLFRKGHFTMLEISKDDQGNVSAVHHDSKGFLSKIMYALGLYSLAPIKNAVTNAFPGASFTTKCHGHQGIRDDVNCGRFILGYIDQKIEGQEISNPSSKFTNIQQKINSPSKNPDSVSPNTKPDSVTKPLEFSQVDNIKYADNLKNNGQSQNINGQSIGH